MVHPRKIRKKRRKAIKEKKIPEELLDIARRVKEVEERTDKAEKELIRKQRLSPDYFMEEFRLTVERIKNRHPEKTRRLDEILRYLEDTGWERRLDFIREFEKRLDEEKI